MISLKYDWEYDYVAAILEEDNAKLPDRISSAERAMAGISNLSGRTIFHNRYEYFGDRLPRSVNVACFDSAVSILSGT